MDPTKRGLGEGVCRNQGQAINPDLMDAVDRLEVTRGDCVRTGTVQTVQNTVHSPRSMCSAVARPVGGVKAREGLLGLMSPSCIITEGLWDTTHTEKGSLEKKNILPKYTLFTSPRE